MKINFTQKEFEALFDMANLADWMLHAHRVEDEKDDYDSLLQKILSHAKDFGLGDQVQYDEDLKQYFTTRDYEESDRIEGVIQTYEEESFWDELALRLATRDLIRRFGEQRYRSMKPEERVSLQLEREEMYTSEFSRNGLDSTHIPLHPTIEPPPDN